MKKRIALISIIGVTTLAIWLGSIYIPRTVLLMDIDYINGFIMPGASSYERTVTVDDHMSNKFIKFFDKYRDDDETHISIKRNWNINKIADGQVLDENVTYLSLTDTCLTNLEGISVYPNLDNIKIAESNLNNLEGLTSMEHLKYLGLFNTQLNRLSNIENIKGNQEPLLILSMGNDLRYITQSSYDYISNPENNVTVELYDQFSSLYATTDDGIDQFMDDSNLEIVRDDWEHWDKYLGEGNYYWDL